ncbi:MAG: serine hydrolase [Bacillota bacterium]|nr:serine hydrolase [Bacillota bacterium]
MGNEKRTFKFAIKRLLIISILAGTIIANGVYASVSTNVPVKSASIINISSKINGMKQSFSQPSVIKNGAYLVPMTQIFNSLGAKITYNKDLSITATKGSKTVKLLVNKNTIYVNQKALTVPAPTQVINKKTMVSPIVVFQLFGATVSYDSKSKTISINTPKIAYLEKQTDTINSFVNSEAEKSNFNGSILVAKGNQILYQRGFGYADIEKGIKNTVDTVFPIASETKSFTAISILQLEQEGKLSINEPLSDFISGFSEGNKITLHNLLTHSSGIKEMLNVVDNGKKAETKDVIDALKNQKLDFEPGTKFHYSNSNYFILGYIIEKLSGMPYHEYVREHILKPAGMIHTSFLTEPTETIASGYKNMGKPSEYIDKSLNFALGDVVSTVGDMLKYNSAIQENKLLNKKETEKMQTGYILVAGSTKYGYGWYITEKPNRFQKKMIEHSGSLPGYKAQFLRFPEDNISIIIMENNESNFDIIQFSRQIAQTF